MIACECDEGECLHPGTYRCDNHCPVELRPIQQHPRTTDSQILQQQQQQQLRRQTAVAPHQAESGETFGDDDDSFGF